MTIASIKYGIGSVRSLLSILKVNGAKLDLVAALQKTQLRDALSIKRPISNRGLSYWNVTFRHDIPDTDWAWGFVGERDVATPFYRLSYQSREANTAITSSLYVEHKDIFGLKARVTAQNLFNQKEKTFETFYVGRRTGPIRFTRDSSIEWGPMLRLTVWGTF